MTTALFYILAGYLSGSVLFARLATSLAGKTAALEASEDGNPGTSNAFRYGGFWCGAATLLGDLGKGAWPVYCFRQLSGGAALGAVPMSLVLFAPVLGHTFPLWHHFRGGKGIAVTFGCLIGLLPSWRPLVLFALVFVFFSVVLRVDPHFYRTAVTYAVTLVLFLFRFPFAIWGGFALISGAVLLRLHLSKEQRTRPAVKLLWMR